LAECPEEITRLVEQFGRNIDSYRESRYKEAQLRKEFIDPFFEALGWDTANRAGKAEKIARFSEVHVVERNPQTKCIAQSCHAC